jgi:hypothetical protein
MRRVIENMIVDPLSDVLLRDTLKGKGTVLIRLKSTEEGQFEFQVSDESPRHGSEGESNSPSENQDESRPR